MKIRRIILLLIFCTATQSMLLPTAAWAIPDKYEVELKKYAKLTEAVSGGFYSGSRILIRIGGHTFYDYRGPRVGLAGLYVVAIYKNEVLLQYHYNTYFIGGASLGFSRDMSKLPYGTFVVVAAKGEATRLFDEHGQKALYSIGAATGLLNQKFRTSYLCIGVKGLAQGKAIEKTGSEELHHPGEKAGEQINLVFPKKKEPRGFSRMPGRHEGLMFGDTEAIYYIPKNFNPDTARYLFGIHGAGAWRRPGALTRIAQFRNTADRENIVIIAPAFTPVLNRTPNRKKDIKNGKFVDPKIVKAHCSFMMLLNEFNEDRSDLKLIKIFEFFNTKLMKRDKFYLDGHSGGGQFVARFVLFHPELIEKAAICSAGSFVFPNRDKDYPYGLKLDNLKKTFGPQIEADDLRLNDNQIDQKLNHMLDLKIYIIAGEKETEQENRPERDWQGKSTLEKAKNFYAAMRDEDRILKQKGLRSSSKPYQYELHVIPNVGHNSHETAKKANELLFGDPGFYATAPESTTLTKAKNEETEQDSLSQANTVSKDYGKVLRRYARHAKVTSGGYRSGEQVHIELGNHTFFTERQGRPGKAGLYLVAVHQDRVLLRYHYNTFSAYGASQWFAHDITALPKGTFVIVASMGHASHRFRIEAERALSQIGARGSLLGQTAQTAYICLGVKGLVRGKAIERIGTNLLQFGDPNSEDSLELVVPTDTCVTGQFEKIYDPSVGQKEIWSINDHCFMRGKDGTWHMFGITGTKPRTPISGKVFTHATAKSLTQVPWDKKPFALKVDPKSKETHLWAPHIIYHNETYYMYYCAGDKDPTKYKIHLAVSKDLETWQRHPENPMVVDGFHARDPFVIKVGNEWVMYYTATTKPTGGHYIVACRKSKDLVHWGTRRKVFRDFISGTGGGPTESPTVVRRGEYYYLFIGPRNEYAGTDVFHSKSPFLWNYSDRVGHIRAHAAEVIRDVDGKWYVSHCGVGQGGVYLAPLYWNDGLDDTDTSLPIPK